MAVLFLRDRGSLIVCEACLRKPDDSEDLHFSSTQAEVAALEEACRSKTTQFQWPDRELGEARSKGKCAAACKSRFVVCT